MAEETEQSKWDIEGEQEVYIPLGTYLPGFPGGHGPGVYLVDFKNRTIRPAPVEIPQPAEENATELQPDNTNEGG